MDMVRNKKCRRGTYIFLILPSHSDVMFSIQEFDALMLLFSW